MTPAETKWETARRWGWLPVVLAVGLTARFWAGTCGHNYDLGSYWVVVDLVEHGQNVYAGTNRYNYGPVWFHLLHLFDWLAGGNSAGFRFLIIGFLSAADALIAWILWRKFGRLVAAWFFLNPVSIMITGYGNQFDNVAILLGLWAVLLLGDDFEGPIDRRKFAGLVVLGLSLMTKHVFFAFPFWLAVRQRGLWQKGVVLLVPVAVFLAGFAPYWAGGRAGIVAHVFLYKSSGPAYLYQALIPGALQPLVSPTLVWLLVLAGFGFLHRRTPVLESLLVYTCALVAAAPATANQYFAIPSAFTSVYVNYCTIAFTCFAMRYIPANVSGPHWLPEAHGGARWAVYALALALVWITWRKRENHLNKQAGKPERTKLRHG